MKKYKLLILNSVLLLSLANCGKNEVPPTSEKQSSENSSTEEITTNENSSNQDEQQNDITYILEDGEVYQQPEIKYGELNKISYNSIKLSGINELAVDPFEMSVLYDAVNIKYPTASTLNGQYVLYTSSWYKRTTFKREDNPKEYIIENVNGKFKITSISDKVENLIPFNGAVLSVPSNSSVSYKVGDTLNITSGEIPQYEIGFYNQDGYRVCISYHNSLNWQSDGIGLYDDRESGYVIESAWVKAIGLNCIYDETKNCFVVDKFRYTTKEGKIHTNVNNGFFLAAENKNNRDNVSLIEGVRFNLKDTINVEDNATLFNKEYTFSLKNVNNYCGTRFSVKQLTDDSNTGNWSLNIAVNSDGIICDSGIKVAKPDGGYRLNLTNPDGAEACYKLTNDLFTLGAKIEITDDNLIIKHNLVDEFEDTFQLIYDLYDKTLVDYETYFYSYDIKTIDDVYETLVALRKSKRELDKKEYTSTDYFALNKMQGILYNQYYRLLAATNRNEAVEVKSTWYIENFATNDKNLETLNKNLDYIRSGGTNEIIVSFYYDTGVNYTNSKIFKEQNNIANNNYGEYGSDYLKAITALAHQKGMKVLINFTPFTNHLENTFTELNDCFALSVTGQKSVTTSQGKVQMLDPSNELVQQRIQDAIRDMLECNPDVDGICLDYIRYGADSNAYNTLLGVTESGRVGFNKWLADNNQSYNYATLDELKNALKTAAILDLFNIYEQTLISKTVKNIKNVCLEYQKPLTAAIADNYSYVKKWKCQDWAAWVAGGYIDGLYLMDYYFDESLVNTLFNDMLTNSKDKCLLVTGIDPSYAGLGDEFYARTIKGGVTNPKSNGFAIFGTHTQRAKYDGWELVKPSNWIDSISPYDSLELTVKATGDLLLQRCQDIYMFYESQNEDDFNKLKADIEELYSLLNGDNIETCNALEAKLKKMYASFYADGEANTRIREQIAYLRKIVSLKKSILGN